jgi:predicted TIM-barrel fold metal-dependent hydrolase
VTQAQTVTLGVAKSETHGLLADPDPRPINYTLISVDEHLVEPRDMFEGRLPAKYQLLAPRVVETAEGHEVWQFDGRIFLQVGLNAVVGRPRQDWKVEPTRFEEMRPGCYQIDARIRDMDINGVWASVNFPSQITGFCGSVFSSCSDLDLGLAVTRAWNDWFYEEWHSPYPVRIVPMGITWLGDADLGAAEIRRNAARGFTAVTLPEQPHRIGLPSVFSGWWDPIIEACAETGTVISLHVGSSGAAPAADDAPRLQVGATLFGQLSLGACVDWVWSRYAVRHPSLRIAMSEGGIGWVAMLIDRLDNVVDRSGYGRDFDRETGLRPSEVLRRNFWFCTIDDPSTICTRHTIGVDHICFETEYPHGDGTWPDSQAVFGDCYGDLPADELAKISHENAAGLYRHPLPLPGSPHAAGLRVPT